jgi:hypothetical protein
MDIQVNKHQLERVVIKWLDKHYGNLTLKEISYFTDTVFYFNHNNKQMMDYNTDNGILHVNNDILMSLVNMFKLTYVDVRTIVPKWMYETYDIDVQEVFGAAYD